MAIRAGQMDRRGGRAGMVEPLSANTRHDGNAPGLFSHPNRSRGR
jgi:hypothetical protein